MHNRSLEDPEEGRGVRLVEIPCEGPSAARHFVRLVAIPYLAAECAPSGDLALYVERRRLHWASAAMLMECA